MSDLSGVACVDGQRPRCFPSCRSIVDMANVTGMKSARKGQNPNNASGFSRFFRLLAFSTESENWRRCRLMPATEVSMFPTPRLGIRVVVDIELGLNLGVKNAAAKVS